MKSKLIVQVHSIPKLYVANNCLKKSHYDSRKRRKIIMKFKQWLIKKVKEPPNDLNLKIDFKK
jgi:hypothetical protein